MTNEAAECERLAREYAHKAQEARDEGFKFIARSLYEESYYYQEQAEKWKENDNG